MSTADPCGRRARASRPERGQTLVETIIVLFIITMIAVVLNGTLAATRGSDRYLAAMRTAAQRGQKLSLEISSLASTSRKLFAGDPTGLAYLAALDLQALPLAPGARLPVLVEDAVLDEDDASEPLTGNVLLFIREADPAPCVALPTAGKIRHIDTYRFVCVYPHVTSQSIAANSGPARDLVVWRSVAYPSYAQITEIQDAIERKNVLIDLYNRYGYRRAWNPDAEAAVAFFEFDKAGNLSATPTASPKITEDREVSDRGRLVYARAQLASTSTDAFAAQTVLSADDPAAWRPDGFEVKVTGTFHSRKLWMHLVVEVPEAGGARTAVLPATVIATCQDM